MRNDNLFNRSVRQARRAGLVLLTLPLLALPTHAHAGNDQARINTDGSVDFTIHYAYPPTQEEIDKLHSALRSASDIMCDATDAQLFFGKVRITAGSTAESTADMWMLPPGLWSRSSSSGFLLEDKSRVFMVSGQATAETLAHEMMHAVTRLPDAYEEQSRFGRYDGIGYAIDPGRCTNSGDPCILVSDCGDASLFPPGLEPQCSYDHLPPAAPQITPAVHTMMGPTPTQRPVCAISGDPCNFGDIDCNTGIGEQCLTPDYFSEVLKQGDYDVVVGDGTGCPTVAPGERVYIRGRLGSGDTPVAFDGSSSELAEASARIAVFLRLLDSQGALFGVGRGSDHELRVYAEYRSAVTDEWTLHFYMLGRELDGYANGDFVPIGDVDIDFGGGTTVYPPSYAPASSVRVWNGSAYVAPGDPGYVTPTIDIPTFSTGAPGQVLELDLGGLFSTGSTNHFLGRSEILAEGDAAQMGDCVASTNETPNNTDDDFCLEASQSQCDGRWNTQTQRWEAAGLTVRWLEGKNWSYFSEWEQLADLDYRYGPTFVSDDAEQFNAAMVEPVGEPVAEPGGCESIGEYMEIETAVTGSDAIMLMVDTSGSMENELGVLGETDLRIDWAKAAAREIVKLVESNNATPGATIQSLGIGEFNTGATVLVDPVSIGASGSPAASVLLDEINDLGPGGNTNISEAAFDAALAAKETPGAMSPSVVLFTDGEANTCYDGAQCGTTVATDEAVSIIEQFGAGTNPVNFFFVPLGGELGQGLFGEALAVAGGEIHVAEGARELPMRFAVAYLQISGFSPALGVTEWAVEPSLTPESAPSPGAPTQLASPTAATTTQGATSVEYPLVVEQGSSEITVLLSTLNSDKSIWDPEVTLVSPSGIEYAAGDAGFTQQVDDEGNFFRVVRVAAVEPGTWELRIRSANPFEQRGYAIAWTNATLPDCYVGTDVPRITESDGTIQIRALASWGGPLADVSYSAVVTRPDDSTIEVPLTIEDDGGPAFVGTFDQLLGRGTYRVDLVCDATEARFFPGENIADLQARYEPEETPPFLREASTSFVVDIPELPPLRPGGDADGDGISDEEEGASCAEGEEPCIPDPSSPDTDGDGVIDAQDEDSDNDEVPDAKEPDGDADGDGIPNRLDPDADGDGILDGVDPDPYTPVDAGDTCDDSRVLLAKAIHKVELGKPGAALTRLEQSLELEEELLAALQPEAPAHGPLAAAVQLEHWGRYALHKAKYWKGKSPYLSHVFLCIAQTKLSFAYFWKGIACDECI